MKVYICFMGHNCVDMVFDSPKKANEYRDKVNAFYREKELAFDALRKEWNDMQDFNIEKIRELNVRGKSLEILYLDARYIDNIEVWDVK